jgi:hypothetical protein
MIERDTPVYGQIHSPTTWLEFQNTHLDDAVRPSSISR